MDLVTEITEIISAMDGAEAGGLGYPFKIVR